MRICILRQPAAGLVLASLLVAGCSPVIAGSGNVITQARPVGGFTAVDLEGTGELLIEQTGTESLEITADDNLLAYLTSDVADGRLTLTTKDNASLRPTQAITYRLTVKNLTAIQISGAAKVDAKQLDTDQLAVAINGSGDVALSGRAGHLILSLAGSGDFRANDLSTKVATIGISGSGQVVVAASDKLDVAVTGSGSIEYIGDPAVTQTIVGSGSVKRRQQ